MKRMVSALRMLAVLSLLTGLAYPGLMLAVGRLGFPDQAGGSLLHRDGRVVGSALLAQKFDDPRYFRPRPSAGDYAAVPSGASNLSPDSKALLASVAERNAERNKEGGGREMLFASGSGLDPDITPESALAQIPRILKARGMNAEPGGADKLKALVKQATQPRSLGFLGQERVNVLLLNLALDGMAAGDTVNARPGS